MAASKNKRLESVPIGKKDKKRPRLFEGALPQCQIPITVASKRESLISTRPQVHFLRKRQDLLIVSCRLAYYSEAAPAPSLNLVVGKDWPCQFQSTAICDGHDPKRAERGTVRLAQRDFSDVITFHFLLVRLPSPPCRPFSFQVRLAAVDV